MKHTHTHEKIVENRGKPYMAFPFRRAVGGVLVCPGHWDYWWAVFVGFVGVSCVAGFADAEEWLTPVINFLTFPDKQKSNFDLSEGSHTELSYRQNWLEMFEDMDLG